MKLNTYTKAIKNTSRLINYFGTMFIIHHEHESMPTYQYIATNKNGDIFLFYDEPIAKSTHSWCSKDSECYLKLLFRFEGIVEILDWRKSLRKINDIVV